MNGVEEAANVATALAIAACSYYFWWKWSEANRMRRFVRGSGSLPSPMPALPRWCGFVGGHTFSLKSGKVRDSYSSQQQSRLPPAMYNPNCILRMECH